jgi:hypothetical protein
MGLVAIMAEQSGTMPLAIVPHSCGQGLFRTAFTRMVGGQKPASLSR